MTDDDYAMVVVLEGLMVILTQRQRKRSMYDQDTKRSPLLLDQGSGQCCKGKLD